MQRYREYLRRAKGANYCFNMVQQVSGMSIYFKIKGNDSTVVDSFFYGYLVMVRSFNYSCLIILISQICPKCKDGVNRTKYVIPDVHIKMNI